MPRASDRRGLLTGAAAFVACMGARSLPCRAAATDNRVPIGPEFVVGPKDVAQSGAGWKPIFKMIPKGGGIVTLQPGDYAFGGLPTWKKSGHLWIRGLPGAPRPRLTGTAGGPPGLGGHKTEWSGLTVSDLIFDGLPGEAGALPFGRFYRLERVTITGSKNNGIHLSNSESLEFEMDDCEITRCGQGNTKHNVYIGRIPSAKIIGLVSHSSKGSHAFKCIAHAIELRDSRLGTVGPDQTVEHDDGNVFVSTTLADLVACGRSLVENVTFDHVSYLGREGDARDTGNQVLSYRARNSILGCDEPPYGEVVLFDGQTETPPVDAEGPLKPAGNDPDIADRYFAVIKRGDAFWSPEFWSTDPPPLGHRIVNCRFIERGQPDRAIAITNEGTEPQIASRQFGPQLLLPTPVGWFERSSVEAVGCTFEGPFKSLAVGPGVQVG